MRFIRLDICMILFLFFASDILDILYCADASSYYTIPTSMDATYVFTYVTFYFHVHSSCVYIRQKLKVDLILTFLNVLIAIGNR